MRGSGPARDLGGVEWIFFDVGFTLLDESHCMMTRFTRAAAAAAQLGVDTTPEEIWRRVEEGYTRFAPSPYRAALEQLPLSREQLDVVYERSPYECTIEMPYPGARELLARLASSRQLGVLANQVPGLPARLRDHGLDVFFRCVCGSGDMGLSKPDRRFFELAVQEAGVAPEAIAMVGDRLDNDIAPANALGWHTVRVRQGMAKNQQPRRESERPDHQIGEIRQLAALFS